LQGIITVPAAAGLVVDFAECRILSGDCPGCGIYRGNQVRDTALEQVSTETAGITDLSHEGVGQHLLD
jgi:hypothetical protein